MGIFLYQIGIFIAIQLSTFYGGRGTRNVAIILISIFTILQVFTSILMFLQFGTVIISYFVSRNILGETNGELIDTIIEESEIIFSGSNSSNNSEGNAPVDKYAEMAEGAANWDGNFMDIFAEGDKLEAYATDFITSYNDKYGNNKEEYKMLEWSDLYEPLAALAQDYSNNLLKFYQEIENSENSIILEFFLWDKANNPTTHMQMIKDFHDHAIEWNFNQ
jgi:hypothetical protein